MRSSAISLNRLSHKGFTLVEVMVALAIVAMALPALIMLVMTQIDGAAHIRNKTYAMWIAENELTRLNLLNNNKERFPNFKLPEKDSGKTEMMGLEWQWQFETSKAEEIPVEGVLKLDIDIAVLGIAEEGAGFKGVGDLEKHDPIARLTGYVSE
jgi:general secretion pathway protein I